MKAILLVYAILFSIQLQAQPWSNLYDFNPDANKFSASNATHYSDKDFFIAAGNTSTDNVSSLHSYLSKLDYEGQLLQTKMLYFPGRYNKVLGGYNVAKMGSGKYVMCGVEQDLTTNPRIQVLQPYLYIFDDNLDSIRFVKFTDTVVTRWPYCITTDKDKNILVAGYCTSKKLIATGSGSFQPDSGFYWIEKYDSNANRLWTKTYFGSKGSDEQHFSKIIPSQANDGYIVCGTHGPNVADNIPQNFIMKINKQGNLVWHKFLNKSYPYGESYGDIISLKDGNYAYITQYSDSLLPSPFPSFRLPSMPYAGYGKFNEHGDTLWTNKFRKFYTSHKGRYIAEATNGDLYIYIDQFYYYDRNTLIRTNEHGRILSYREYMPIDTPAVQQELNFMSCTPNNKVLLSGSVYSYQNIPGYFDSTGTFSWFVLTDSLGCLQPGCESVDTMWYTNVKPATTVASEIDIYPNPATNSFSIKTSTEEAFVEIYTISGQLLLQTHKSQHIDISILEPGIYYIRVISSNGKITVGKLLKE